MFPAPIISISKVTETFFCPKTLPLGSTNRGVENFSSGLIEFAKYIAAYIEAMIWEKTFLRASLRADHEAIYMYEW